MEFNMPKLDHTMEEGTVVAWRKQVGEQVQKGEVLLEVETNKAVLEVESNVSGVLRKILVEAGEQVPVGAALAIFEPTGESE